MKDTVSVVMWALGPNDRSGIFSVYTGCAWSFRELAVSVLKALDLSEAIEYQDMPRSTRDRYQFATQTSLDCLHQAGYSSPVAALDAVADFVRKNLAQPGSYR